MVDFLPPRVAGASSVGWDSYEQMRKAGAEIEVVKGLGWCRKVWRHTGRQVERDGLLYNQRSPEWRQVALSLEDARLSRRDYWGGPEVGWIRNGIKAEQEAPENLGAGNGPNAKVELEIASDEEQAAHRARLAREVAVLPQVIRSDDLEAALRAEAPRA